MNKKVICALLGPIFILSLAGCNSTNKPNESVKPIETPTENITKDVSKEYVYRHRDTAAGGNNREAYIWDAMEAALKATETDYGPFQIELVQDINQEREDFELINDTGLITITSDSLNQNNLDNLQLLKFPVLRDLLGYRVFLIDKKRQEEFSKIKTIEDLKKYQFGIGIGWNDKKVLEHAQLKVYEESEYKMLFKDVSTGIIDIFSRGINEVVDEYDLYSKEYDNLVIEKTVLLYYPLPRYFWFSKSETGERLKNRLDEGFKRIVADGTFEALFNQYFKEDLDKLNLKERTLIKLENPIYTEEYEKNDQPYKYDPLQ